MLAYTFFSIPLFFIFIYLFLFIFLTFLLKKFFFIVYFWQRERDRAWAGEGQRKRGRHRIGSRPQALSCQHRAQRGARTQEQQDHDLDRSWTLKQLSHPDAPVYVIFKKFNIYILTWEISTFLPKLLRKN